MQTTGDFEISESGSMSVSGKIKETESSETDLLPYKDTPTMELSSADVYKELRLRGYDYGSEFRGISAADINGKHTYISRCIKKIKLAKYMNTKFLKLFYREIWRIDLEQQLDFLLGYHATNVNFTSVW